MTALWIAFIVFVLIAVALDLGVFHPRGHVMTTRDGFFWTAVWIATALLFNVLVYFIYDRHWFSAGTGRLTLTGGDAALKFFTGYVIEKSLSLDNIFVIALIFSYFHVPPASQHRVLFLGILGALVLRGVMIALGAAMIRNFSWTTYLFGGILLLTAARMLTAKHDKVDPEHNPLVRLTRRLFPVSHQFHGDYFFIREQGRLIATPLLIVLLVVESTDVLFAVDSIPAIFAITSDPFIVFTSNVFAVLGLRALYFVLAGVINRFRYLKVSLVIVLAFVGVKLLLAHKYPIPTLVSLAVIAGILTIGITASIIATRRDVVANEATSTPSGLA